MINVSSEFFNTMKERTDFKENAEITFLDGTKLSLTERNFTISNNSICDGAGSTGVPLGEAIEKSIQMELMNDDDHLSIYDFNGARIRLFLTFQLSSNIEKIEYGTYTVVTPETYGQTVIITAVDDMYKADKTYSSTLTFPTTIRTMLVDICNKIGVPLLSTSFSNDNFIVDTNPSENLTFRQVIGYIAMIAGGNARINRTGYLEIVSYDFTELEKITKYNGGKLKPWDTGNVLDGGKFNVWNIGDIADGGDFADMSKYHVLYEWKNIKVDTDDIVITGIQTTYQDSDLEKDVAVLIGTEGYVLSVENPLWEGKEHQGISLIAQALVGGRFRKFEGDHISYPLAEFMDPAIIVDRKGNTYATIITDIDFTFFGLTVLKNSAEQALRNSSKYYSEATETYRQARKLIQKEQTTREQAIESLSIALANSSGMYITSIRQPDGSNIYYMHNKSALEESDIIWKLTAESFGISTDGGDTYPYGFTVTGEMITRLLYAEGINANYINTGAISVKDSSGNTIFLVDMDTKRVVLSGDFVSIGSRTATEAVESKVAKGDVSQQISGEVGNVSILSNRLTIQADNFKLNSSGEIEACGTMTCKSDTGRRTVLGSGIVQFYRNNEYIGSISGFGDAYNAAQGIGIYTTHDSVNLGVGDIRQAATAYFYMNNGMNPGGFTERHIFREFVRFANSACLSGSLYLSNDTRIGAGYTTIGGVTETGAYVVGSLCTEGSFLCKGTKSRAVETKNYGTVLMNAFETAGAYFSDIGSGRIEDDCCYVYLDGVFLETIDTNQEYQVQITRTSKQETSYVEKHKEYFIVYGDAGASFDWMVMAKQKNYQNVRAEVAIMDSTNEIPYDMSIFYDDGKAAAESEKYMMDMEQDLAKEALTYLDSIEKR